MRPRITAPACALLLAATLALPAPAAPEVAPPPHLSGRAYHHSAIGAVLWANGGRVPDTGTELRAALDKLGDFVQVAVPFSGVDLESGLAHPRVVIAPRPSTHPRPVPPGGGSFGGSFGGWGGAPVRRTQPKPEPVLPPPQPIGSTPERAPHLDGRLFLAANTARAPGGKVRVRTVEFISWNSAALKFDFGVIEDMGTGNPQLKVLDGVRCFACHKNRGPIFGASPWSNTVHSPAVRSASTELFRFPFVADNDGRETATRAESIDGLDLLRPHAAEVDAAVRHGADLLRHRELAKVLARSADGRKALVALLTAVSDGRDLRDDRDVRTELNKLNLVAYQRDAHAINKATPGSALADFSPAAPPRGAATAAHVRVYDAARAGGAHGVPSAHQPSNPKALVRSAPAAPQRPSEVLSVAQVARAIGLTESDRGFLVRHVPPRDLSAVFTGPQFADVLTTGVLPDRDDFKDRVVAAVAQNVRVPRAEYAWGPVRDPNFVAARDTPQLPSHACLACHDVKGQKSGAFSPIPPLAFDPLDASARAAWAKGAPPAKRADVLTRLHRRVATDRDMPPEDSVEHELYRAKDATALAGLKEWLERELKGAK